ncbi:MAG: hypothetical protein PHY16_17245 [Methylobacter sp.]|nr:hypothetical protein [Methylobacter sp.]
MKNPCLAGALLSIGTCLVSLPCTVFATSENPDHQPAKITEGIKPPPPCHPNPNAQRDIRTVLTRGDIRHLPDALKGRLSILAGRPHSQLPTQAYAEAQENDKPKPSQLFQYYLLDTKGFEPNPFTSLISGVNDQAMLTATGADCGLPTVGAVRVVLEPKPGLPTNPNDPGAFIDIFTDIDPLFVINNESGWYEGWMIHDLLVAPTDDPRPDGHAKFGKLTKADADILKTMGTFHNIFIPSHHVIFTTDGKNEHFPSPMDLFPDRQTNVVPIQLSMGAYNCLQQSDCHAYWEFNYTTNWIHPLYELPFTGGIPGTFEAGKVGALQSIVPGSGPNGVNNDAVHYGDNPNNKGVLQASGPRDPDKFDLASEEDTDDSQREFRMRFIPSGLANEIMLDVYERLGSFEPGVTDFNTRLFDAYAAEVARVETTVTGGVIDGVISAVEGDIDTASDGFKDNSRLFLAAPTFKRFAVTREINDGLLAPRFAPSQKAWVLSGKVVPVSPSVPASAGEDGDDR